MPYDLLTLVPRTLIEVFLHGTVNLACRIFVIPLPQYSNVPRIPLIYIGKRTIIQWNTAKLKNQLCTPTGITSAPRREKCERCHGAACEHHPRAVRPPNSGPPHSKRGLSSRNCQFGLQNFRCLPSLNIVMYTVSL